MKRQAAVLTGMVLVVVLGAVELLFAGQNFDKLSDQDRQAFSARFEKEVWPLMVRNGKDGCVGCHSGKIVADLRLSGDAKKDFAVMLKQGFFIHDDEGSVLARVTEKDKTRRMPKGKEAWSDKEIQVLRQFSADLDKKQKK